jgi:hypothetical protein
VQPLGINIRVAYIFLCAGAKNIKNCLALAGLNGIKVALMNADQLISGQHPAGGSANF